MKKEVQAEYESSKWKTYRHGIYLLGVSGYIICHSNQKTIPSRYTAIENAVVQKSKVSGYKYFIIVKAKENANS